MVCVMRIESRAMHGVCSLKFACNAAKKIVPPIFWHGDVGRARASATSIRSRGLAHDVMTRARGWPRASVIETLASSLAIALASQKSTLKRELNPSSDAADSFADSLGPVRHHCERAEQLRRTVAE